MGRKKRSLDFVKPFCYYCDKVFNNEILLQQHQKSVHFTCQHCKKKFPTSHNIAQHFLKQHEYALERIPNAMPGRDNPGIKIYGMTGVPSEISETRTMARCREYYLRLFEEKRLKAEAAERANLAQLAAAP